MENPKGVAALRAALGSKLDVRIQTRVQSGGRSGGWSCLSHENMREVFEFRCIHMEGNKQLKDWVAGLPAVDRTEQSWAFAFLHNADDSVRELPDACSVGLASATKFFNVKFLSYQVLSVPVGVAQVNAEQFLPFERFNHLLNMGVPIAQLGDFIRLRAAHSFGRGGWVIDCDTFWLRRPTVLAYPWCHPQYGHQFGSMHASPCWRTGLADFQYWSVHFLRKPMDKLYLATPFFPSNEHDAR